MPGLEHRQSDFRALVRTQHAILPLDWLSGPDKFLGGFKKNPLICLAQDYHLLHQLSQRYHTDPRSGFYPLPTRTQNLSCHSFAYNPSVAPLVAFRVKSKFLIMPYKVLHDIPLLIWPASSSSTILLLRLSVPVALTDVLSLDCALCPPWVLAHAVPSSQKLPFSSPPFQGDKYSSSLRFHLRYHFFCMSS